MKELLGELELDRSVDVVSLDLVNQQYVRSVPNTTTRCLEELTGEHVEAGLLDDDGIEVLCSGDRPSRVVVQRRASEPGEAAHLQSGERRVVSAFDHRLDCLPHGRSRYERGGCVEQHDHIALNALEEPTNEILHPSTVGIEARWPANEADCWPELIFQEAHDFGVAGEDNDVVDLLDSCECADDVIDEWRTSERQDILSGEPLAVELGGDESDDTHPLIMGNRAA